MIFGFKGNQANLAKRAVSLSSNAQCTLTYYPVNSTGGSIVKTFSTSRCLITKQTRCIFEVNLAVAGTCLHGEGVFPLVQTVQPSCSIKFYLVELELLTDKFYGSMLGVSSV